MKIVAVDNHARESVADILIAENVNENYLRDILLFLNRGEGNPYFFNAFEDDYRLSRGMKDLV